MPLNRFFLFVLISCQAVAAPRPDWESLRAKIRQTLHIPDPLPDLRSKSYVSFSPAPDVVADRVSFATDYGLRVPAIVYHPAGAHAALRNEIMRSKTSDSWYND